MKIEFAECDGVGMPKGWPEEIEKAQSVPMIGIGGRLRERVRYRSRTGTGYTASMPCHECRVSAGQQFICCECGGVRAYRLVDLRSQSDRISAKDRLELIGDRIS